MQTRTTNGQATTVSRYQYDNHLGSACLELDDIGQVISYEEYYPFGSTSYRSGRNETEVSLKRYKYCGKEKDEETGLYYYGMRYYADWLCRFVSVDPLQFKHPELTPFQYASNNPVTMIDLDGAEGVKPEKKSIPTGVSGVGTENNPVLLQPTTVSLKDIERRNFELIRMLIYQQDWSILNKGHGNRTQTGYAPSLIGAVQYSYGIMIRLFYRRYCKKFRIIPL